MKMLGKVAFIPVIASGMIAAGAGAGVAMAATTPDVTVTPNASHPTLPFTTQAAGSVVLTSQVGGATTGFATIGDTLVCTVSEQLPNGGQKYYYCTDNNIHKSGWIISNAVS